tara:strand:- start:4499 stop:4897 length:399 start_codon:yes stop_codon:yes gene_type:complete
MARKFYIQDEVSVGDPGIVFELTQPSGYTQITDEELIKELYIRQYKYRILDGKDYVLNFTAERYIDLVNGLYTEAEVFSLESHVKNLFDELNNGLWLTAQNTNSNLEVSGIYTQLMKSEIQLDLDNYVSENY